MKKSIPFLVLSFIVFDLNVSSKRKSDQLTLLSFNDDGYAVYFNKKNQPVKYEDGGDLGYDDEGHIIIYDKEKTEPLGYIMENGDGEYEFYEYEEENTGDEQEEGGLISNTAAVAKSSLSGFAKLGKKIGNIFWWPKKEKGPTPLQQLQLAQVAIVQQQIVQQQQLEQQRLEKEKKEQSKKIKNKPKSVKIDTSYENDKKIQQEKEENQEVEGENSEDKVRDKND